MDKPKRHQRICTAAAMQARSPGRGPQPGEDG
jgi:hypothetical protein